MCTLCILVYRKQTLYGTHEKKKHNRPAQYRDMLLLLGSAFYVRVGCGFVACHLFGGCSLLFESIVGSRYGFSLLSRDVVCMY